MHAMSDSNVGCIYVCAESHFQLVSDSKFTRLLSAEFPTHSCSVLIHSLIIGNRRYCLCISVLSSTNFGAAALAVVVVVVQLLPCFRECSLRSKQINRCVCVCVCTMKRVKCLHNKHCYIGQATADYYIRVRTCVFHNFRRSKEFAATALPLWLQLEHCHFLVEMSDR